MDELRPDPMQEFYRRRGRIPWPEAPPVDDDSSDLRPLPEFRVRWTGFLWLGGFVALCVLVSHLFGVGAAEALVAVGLFGLALSVMLARAGHAIPWFDVSTWMGGGEGPDVHVHGDLGGHFHGGDGGHH
jgi:hypothetical protein